MSNARRTCVECGRKPAKKIPIVASRNNGENYFCSVACTVSFAAATVAHSHVWCPIHEAWYHSEDQHQEMEH